jgi:hypothetical protein
MSNDDRVATSMCRRVSASKELDVRSVSRVNSLGKLLETGIATKTVEAWIYPDPHQPMRSFLHGLSQPNESLFLIFQSGIN